MKHQREHHSVQQDVKVPSNTNQFKEYTVKMTTYVPAQLRIKGFQDLV